MIEESIEIVAKTALSVISVGGTLITEVWNAIRSNEINRRLEEWKVKIEERLAKLQNSLEDISNDSTFTTVILSATEMTIKVAENEKREYLANGVRNSVSSEMEESIQLMFISAIS